MNDLENLETGSLKGLLEALLLVSDDSVSAIELSRVTGAAPGDVASALAELSAEYADANRGFQLREVAGGWRLYTHPAYHDQVADYVLSWDTRHLSQAALETLAVIAYHQPVSRDGVRAVRGVNSDSVIASLKEKGLIREVGRDAEHGQAQLFGTTRLFLERFGLKSLRDLPPLEDFAPDEESKQLIRERLSSRPVSEAQDTEDDEELDLWGDEDAEPVGAVADEAASAADSASVAASASADSDPAAPAPADSVPSVPDGGDA